MSSSSSFESLLFCWILLWVTDFEITAIPRLTCQILSISHPTTRDLRMVTVVIQQHGSNINAVLLGDFDDGLLL